MALSSNILPSRIRLAAGTDRNGCASLEMPGHRAYAETRGKGAAFPLRGAGGEAANLIDLTGSYFEHESPLPGLLAALPE